MENSEAEPTAHISLSLSASSPTFSLSGVNDATNPFQLIVTARIVSSSKPESAVTLETNYTPLEHGSGLANALFRGGLKYAVDINDKSRVINLSPHVRVNWGSAHDQDMRKVGFLQFITVPASEEVAVKLPITAERMFSAHNDHGLTGLGPKDVKPGDKFRIRIEHTRESQWWHFGNLDGDLKDKKFLSLFDQEDGRIPDFKTPEEEQEWVFTYKWENLKMTAEEGNDSVVIEFVE